MKNRNVIIVSAALLIVSLGFGMVIPIFPFYIDEMGGSGSKLGLLIAIAAFTELVFGPIWGSVSDRIGRKPVLIVGLVGYTLSALLMGLSTTLWMLFAARALSGILSSATSATTMAYIGDSTDIADRAGGMGILGAVAGLGVILGPAFGGWLGVISLSTPFFAAATLSAVTVLFVVILLPESLPVEQRRISNPKRRVNRMDLLKTALQSAIGILLFMVFLASIGLANFESVFGLYALEKFDYGPGRVGTILTVVGLVSTAGKIFTGSVTQKWGDEVVIKISLIAGAIAYLVLLTANTYVTILLSTGFFILSKTFLRPSILSLISKRSKIGQGTAMGLSNSAISLGRIVGPIWAGYVFDVNVNYPYFSGAVTLFIGFLISLFVINNRPKEGVSS
jgi:DHA1 family multidrug resistance protein-like MFS transporter